MYCRHCGTWAQPGASTCLNCGVLLGTGSSYCPHCAGPTEPMAVICVQCGRPLQIYRPDAKSKIAAGLLGIFLGGLGVHNFYLGYTGKALAQLLISLLTCGTGAPFMVIWGLIEGIMVLTGSIAVDGKGFPLRE